jgi:hypothetical protein
VTYRQLLEDALAEIGVGNPGEVVSAADMQLSLRWIQRLLNAWRADATTITVNDKVGYTVAAGVSAVTIGPGGMINRQRPVFIDQINYVNPGSNPEVEVPMGPMSDQQFQNLTIKGLPSSLETQYYYQTSVTTALGTLTVWPVATQNLKLYLYIPTSLDDAPTLDTVFTAPPAYEDALHYELAYRLCLPFGRPIPDGLAQLRQNALMVMKRPNEEPMILGVDSAITAGGGGAYNVLSDMMTGTSGRN